MSKIQPEFEIHHLIGWIPETVLLKNIQNKTNLWERMKFNFKEGNIVVCICKKETSSINDPSILPVLDIWEYKDCWLVKVQNPTGGFTNFDVYKPNEDMSYTGELLEPVVLKKGSNRKKENIYWLNWNDILENYTHLSLCWNPSIYPNSTRVHSSWRNKFYTPL